MREITTLHDAERIKQKRVEAKNRAEVRKSKDEKQRIKDILDEAKVSAKDARDFGDARTEPKSPTEQK